MSRFGNKQVNRFIEKEKMATEDTFESSISADEQGSTSNEK